MDEIDKLSEMIQALQSLRAKMKDINLEEIAARYSLARMAGEHAVDAGRGWSKSTEAAVTRSWQDVYDLHRIASELRNVLEAL